MTRPVSISHQQILDAAREVFFEHGFVGASTSRIARRAKVSEGSLYTHFPTKQALFRAAMDLPQPPVASMNDRVGQGDIKENLEAMAVDSIRFLMQLLPRLMMRWSNRGEAGVPKSKASLDVLVVFTKYFEAEIALGRLRAGDPQIMARVFMGSLWNFCFLRILAGDQSMTAETYAHRLAACLVDGIGPTADS